MQEGIGMLAFVLIGLKECDETKVLDELKAIKAGISALQANSLTQAKLNQMLHLCCKPGISYGFYKYYFLSEPKTHPYPVRKIKINNSE